jgi:hypothetical protein
MAAVRGNLKDGLTIKDLLILNSANLPKGNKIKIKKIEVRFGFLDPKRNLLKIDNGWLVLSHEQKLLFQGNYISELFDFNIYARDIDFKSIGEFITFNKHLDNVEGAISELDCFVRGNLREFILTGNVYSKKLQHQLVTISNLKVAFDFKLSGIKNKLKLVGTAKIIEGYISRPRIGVNVATSGEVVFMGDPNLPKINIQGKTRIEDVDILITVKGDLKKPELKISSKPSFSQEKLLLMLVTGKKWQNTEDAVLAGQLSPDIAKDFIDYFVFSGQGSKISEKYGFDISIQYDKKSQGFSLKKIFTDETQATYNVKQSKDTEAKPDATQSLGVGQKITNEISVEAEKEIIQKKQKTTTDESKEPNDKVLIKYESNF